MKLEAMGTPPYNGPVKSLNLPVSVFEANQMEVLCYATAQLRVKLSDKLILLLDNLLV